MRRPSFIVGLALALASGILWEDARGAGRVEVEVVTERDASPVAAQTWGRELAEAGVRNVRFRQQRTGDRPGVAVRGTTGSPLYLVTGVLDSQGQLALPEGRYRSGEAPRVAAWLDELARLGPPESREPIVAFGLPRSQMAAVRDDLAARVAFSTRGQPRSEVVHRIVGGLASPVRMDRSLLRTNDKDRVEEELKGLSSGTSLAAVLRPAGLALAPRMGSTGPELVIDVARGRREVWPVGWKPEERVTRFLPKMFESVTINLENIPASDVIDAIGQRVAVPVLLDHAALARQAIDLGKRVNVPKDRTTYADALDRALFQARMKCELRADEAGRPLVWITTLKQ